MANNGNKGNTSVLTLRIPNELKDRISLLSSRMHSKPSKLSQNLLSLSKIMIVKEDFSKTGYDNFPLSIYPEGLMNEFFRIINGDVNNSNRFKIWSDLGDKMGQYLNNIFSLTGVNDDDFVGKFEIIRMLGWFDFVISHYSDSHNIILIPKNFGTQPMVYSMIFRMIRKVRYPAEWSPELLRNFIPHPNTTKKDEKKINQPYIDNYDNHIKNVMDPDLQKEQNLNFYYFRKLLIPKN